jgi:uncharacterized protein YvpB
MINIDKNNLTEIINEKTFENINTDKIIIKENESYYFDYDIDINITIEDNNIACIKENKVTPVSIGKTKIYLEYKNYKKEIELEIIRRDLEQNHEINVTNIMQYPELPTGCEITSLTIVLNYLGFDVDKCDMADNFLTKGTVGIVTPYTAFLGNPRNNYSYGCYSPVIIESAEKYLDSVESDFEVYDLTGTDFKDLFYEIQNDNPIIIWATANLVEPVYTSRWVIDGEEFTWKANQHCLVLTGYDLDENIVYVADPLRGNVSYDLELFKTRYEQMYKQAIVIKQKTGL